MLDAHCLGKAIEHVLSHIGDTLKSYYVLGRVSKSLIVFRDTTRCLLLDGQVRAEEGNNHYQSIIIHSTSNPDNLLFLIGRLNSDI